MKQTRYKPIIRYRSGLRLLAFGTIASTLSACSWVGSMAKETLVSATAHRGWDTFTLTGTVPADYSFRYTAYYHPQEGYNCTFYSPNAGGQVSRKYSKREETERKPDPQSFSFSVPLAYYKGGCKMNLVNVDLMASAKYMEGDFGNSRAGGALGVYTKKPRFSSEFSENGSIELRAKCMWLFRLIGRDNNLIKILTCHEANEQWQVPEDYDKRSGMGASVQRDKLVGKTIEVNFKHSLEERPYFRNKWIKDGSDWKPCLGDGPDDPYGFCKNKKDFRAFRMNSHTCTIYPACQ